MTGKHRRPFWLVCSKNRGPWFRWGLCHLPWKPIDFSKRPPLQGSFARKAPGGTARPLVSARRAHSLCSWRLCPRAWRAMRRWTASRRLKRRRGPPHEAGGVGRLGLKLGDVRGRFFQVPPPQKKRREDPKSSSLFESFIDHRCHVQTVLGVANLRTCSVGSMLVCRAARKGAVSFGMLGGFIVLLLGVGIV